jgi:hypothetical protein
MKNKLSLLLLFIIPLVSFAQNEDLQLWGSLKFSKKVNSKIRFELQEQVRWADSLSTYKKNFTDIGFRYNIRKAHSLGLNVRIVNEFEEDKYMRMNFDFSSAYSFKKKPVTLKQRLRFQQSWDSMGELNKTHLRVKWLIALKRKLINPYVSHEVYWKMAATNEFNQRRSTLGIAWSMMDKLKMKLFLRSQKEFNNKNPDQLQIIGFGVHYKI